MTSTSSFSCLALNAPPEPALQSLVFGLTLKVREIIPFFTPTIITCTVAQVITTPQPNDAEAVYRALVALGNMLYAAKQFGTILPAGEIARTRSILEDVGNISFSPKPGQSAMDLAAEKRKILNVAKEILTTL